MQHKIFAGMLVWLLIVIAPLTIAATKARAGDPLFILQEKLLASDADPSAELGYSLILSDDAQILVVGARLQDVGSHNDQGQVYIFQRNGHSWTEVQRLVASDGAANDQFGFSLAIADAPNYRKRRKAPAFRHGDVEPPNLLVGDIDRIRTLVDLTYCT